MTGNIKGITIELNGDTTKLDKALRGVNKETRTVQRQLSEVERSLKMDPGNTDLIKRKQRLLGEEVKSTQDKLSMLKEADKEVAKEMEAGTEGATEKHNELQRQIAITEAKEKALQRELDKLSSVPSKTEKIAAGFKNAGKKITGVSEKIGKVGEGFTKNVTLPIAAAGAASAKAWSEVDDAMDTVVTKTGASGKELKSIGGIAGIMGKAIGFITSPVGMVVATIAAAVAIGIILYKNWDKIKSTAVTVFNAVKGTIVSVMNTIGTV